jgi:cysteine desulfurase/selenocysteine lyase
VKETCFKSWALPFRFEPGTPNVNGALSLLKAFEYIENIGWFEKIEEVEKDLVEYALEKFQKFSQIHLIWSKKTNKRVGVFSFYIDGVHALDIADMMAEHNICIRAGQHCTEPFMDSLWIKASARMSLYIYNTTQDIDRFFEVLEENFL